MVGSGNAARHAIPPHHECHTTFAVAVQRSMPACSAITPAGSLYARRRAAWRSSRYDRSCQKMLQRRQGHDRAPAVAPRQPPEMLQRRLSASGILARSVVAGAAGGHAGGAQQELRGLAAIDVGACCVCYGQAARVRHPAVIAVAKEGGRCGRK